MAAIEATATRQVFDHHLGAFAQGLDALMSDYTERSVLQLQDRSLRGLREIRRFFDDFLASAQPAFWAAFEVRRREVEGEIAYLVWRAPPFVELATDTLLVRDGKILIQTYTALA